MERASDLSVLPQTVIGLYKSLGLESHYSMDIATRQNPFSAMSRYSSQLNVRRAIRMVLAINFSLHISDTLLYINPVSIDGV